MAKLIQCPSCHQKISSEAVYCPKCKARIFRGESNCNICGEDALFEELVSGSHPKCRAELFPKDFVLFCKSCKKAGMSSHRGVGPCEHCGQPNPFDHYQNCYICNNVVNKKFHSWCKGIKFVEYSQDGSEETREETILMHKICSRTKDGRFARSFRRGNCFSLIIGTACFAGLAFVAFKLVVWFGAWWSAHTK
jgi:hypothetical protein